MIDQVVEAGDSLKFNLEGIVGMDDSIRGQGNRFHG